MHKLRFQWPRIRNASLAHSTIPRPASRVAFLTSLSLLLCGSVHSSDSQKPGGHQLGADLPSQRSYSASESSHFTRNPPTREPDKLKVLGNDTSLKQDAPELDAIAANQPSQKSRQSGHFGWVTDLHLDLFYDPWITEATYCRNQSSLREIHQRLRWLTSLAHRLDRDTEDHPHGAHSQKFQLVAEELVPPLFPASSMPQGGIEALLPGYHGRYGCDPPASLLWSAFLSMRETFQATPIDFLIVTGDMAGHYWTRQTNRFGRLQSLEAATWLLEAALSENLEHYPNCTIDASDPVDFMRSILDETYYPDGRQAAACLKPLKLKDRVISKDLVPQVIICPGNNDMEKDYIAEKSTWWNSKVQKLWGRYIPDDQQKLFRDYMYYAAPLERVPGVTAVCVNTMWWDKVDSNEEADPAGQFAWLESILSEVESRREQILIIGHIPPTHSLIESGTGGFCIHKEWHDKYNRRYHELILRFRETVAGQYFGHFHSDEFRLQFDRKNGHVEPTGLIIINSGLCMNHGENPGWRLNSYSLTRDGDNSSAARQKFLLTDFQQNFAPLYGSGEVEPYEFNETASAEGGHRKPDFGTFDPGALLTYRQEYSGADRFNVTEFSEESILSNFWEPATKLPSTNWLQTLLDTAVVQGRRPPSFVMQCIIVEDWERIGVRRCVEAIIGRNNSHPPANGGHQDDDDIYFLVTQ